MFQKFHTDTLITKFIKQILATESTPLLSFIHIGDYMFKDCLYLYQHFVVKCCESGFFNPVHNDDEDKQEFLLAPEFPDNYDYTKDPRSALRGHIYPTKPEENDARFIVVKHFDPENMLGFSSMYRSPLSWYDSATHRVLGQYLRYIRDYEGLDLMRYYNCYDTSEITGVHLNVPVLTELYPLEYRFPRDTLVPGRLELTSSNKSGKSYELKTNSMYRVVSIPIKFGETYTIAIDCPTAISLRSVIYSENRMLEIDSSQATSAKYYSDWLETTYMLRVASYFNQPFTYKAEIPRFSLTPEECKALHDRENDLRLLIQIPVHNNSSIVVLEGDYTNTTSSTFNSSISLLKFNTHESYAFSDRLVEYLLENVITSKDIFSDNIKYVQKALLKSNVSYSGNIEGISFNYGVWDSKIKSSIEELVKDSHWLWDQDGNVNKEIENILVNTGGYRLR